MEIEASSGKIHIVLCNLTMQARSPFVLKHTTSILLSTTSELYVNLQCPVDLLHYDIDTSDDVQRNEEHIQHEGHVTHIQRQLEET